MHCQKCRSILRLDNSLEDLNPAAYDLLVGSTGKSVSEPSETFASRPGSQDRKDRYHRASRQATSPVYKRTVPTPRHGQRTSGLSEPGSKDATPGMSFVMLNESQIQPPPPSPHRGNSRAHQAGKNALPGLSELDLQNDEKSFSDQAERIMQIFEIISARSDIDHPICADCTELLIDGLQKRLSTTTKERDAYISFLKNLNTSIPSTEDVKAAEETLAATLSAETEAFDQLLSLEKEKEAVDREIAGLEEEARHLDLEEQEFWRGCNDFSVTLVESENERDALNVKYDHDSRQLERLKRTNVYNDAFCISHDGNFGTINGLRLGRLANPSVEWSEINAAWGQTLLLLVTLAERLGYQFQGYKLRPMGSTSKIEKIEYPQQQHPPAAPPPSPDQPNHPDSLPNGQNPNQPHKTPSRPPPKVTSLDLFSSGDLPLNLPWLHRRFDAGMVAFLECLRQLGAHVEKTTTPVSTTPASSPRPGYVLRRQQLPQVTGLRLPYEIRRDKIGDASIRLGFNQNDESWTRACKYTLTCCKFLLAHACNLAAGRSSI